MTSDRVIYEAVQLLAETLQGGPARRLPSAGVFSPKLGGPQALAALFAPVSPDPAIAGAFRERHESHMRAEVFAAVCRALERWGHVCQEGCDQSHFDDLVVTLAHLRLMLRSRRGDVPAAPIAEDIFVRALTLHDELAGRWFQPLIRDKLNG
ncbi:hypothetical protein KIPE111705_15815 [Kibdelosporangium persicum]|uniref:Uncharacterized protein n=1 Tax=Kibdelosporangium persicum TaxID=2698649 RepID=A0ABX2F1B9_9PSEU|nr:hypothetical protein [Kibdelosporangium persicum]NRN65111.1 hypothetical protein [Kibdelosporangium persicum]